MPEVPGDNRLMVNIDVLTLLRDSSERTQEMFTEIKSSISGLLTEFEVNSREVSQRQTEQDVRISRLESGLELHKEVGHPEKFKYVTALESRTGALEDALVKMDTSFQALNNAITGRRLQIATLIATLVGLVTIAMGFASLAGHVTLH